LAGAALGRVFEKWPDFGFARAAEPKYGTTPFTTNIQRCMVSGSYVAISQLKGLDEKKKQLTGTVHSPA